MDDHVSAAAGLLGRAALTGPIRRSTGCELGSASRVRPSHIAELVFDLHATRRIDFVRFGDVGVTAGVPVGPPRLKLRCPCATCCAATAPT